jgi:uncharacterized sporulation protein YeaH/YhbH (DUF444 family)
MTTDRRGATHVNLDEVPPRDLVRIQRLARELRLTDQILSIDLDTVSVEPTGPAPAWTTLDGDKVSFAYDRMPTPQQRVDIAVWLGTNAHELGHVLFSPRKSSTLMFRVIESDRAFLPGIATMHNIVEDQRQERLVLARFAPWTGYLTAALGHHLRADDESAWLLMAGRTWLPDAVRAQAKARMIATRGQHDTDEVTRLVGEYQRLTDPGDTESDEAWSILQDLHRMFEDATPPSGGGCTVMTGGEPETGEPSGTPPLTADEDPAPGESTDDDSDDDGTGGDGTDDDDADDGDDDGDSDGNGNGRTDSTGTSPGTGAGDGDRPINNGDLRKQLRDAARDAIDKNEEAKRDLDSITDAIDHGRPGDNADGDDPLGRYVEATDAARILHHEVGDALLDMKDDNEPGWDKRVDSGRLNVRRMLNPHTDLDEMFDRYEPGMMDASEMDVVLLLDVSASMNAQVQRLAEATWAIRHAVDDLDGRITVITYEMGPHRILAAPGERPDGRMFVPQAGGGTAPRSAIREAFRLMSGADAKNRLFIVLTDGDWFEDGNESNELIAAMGAMGVTTVCALIGDATRTENFHRCEYGGKLNDGSDLARLFRTVAIDRIASWRR